MKFPLFALLFIGIFQLFEAVPFPQQLNNIRVRRQDVPNGCDPATGIGGFLLFPALKTWCEEQGATEFGVYGRR